MRLVPGLGTRAVDRLKDDYPVLLAPGQPGLRVNVTPDEVAALLAQEGRRHQPGDAAPSRPSTIDELLRAHGRTTTRARPRCSRSSRTTTCGGPSGSHLDFEKPTGSSSRSRGSRAETPFMRADQGRARDARARDGHARGHRVRLRRAGALPAAVPAAELARRRAARADPAQPAARPRPLHREPVRLERPRARPHAHRLRGPGRATTTSPTSRRCVPSAAPSGGSTSCCPSASSRCSGPAAGAAAATSGSASA